MNKNQPLLQPFNKNGLNLKNRVVMAPLTRCRANNKDKVPTDDLHGIYYEQRASAGLIITEGSQVSKRAVGYPNTPGIYTKEQTEGWKKITQRVHKKGGKIFIQLWHVGRVAHPDLCKIPPLAPSAINPNKEWTTPNGVKQSITPIAMTKHDIETTINDFKIAAKNAVEAGFDGVEIHASNGYLFHQFFNKCSNIRTDEYGGNIENRARFLFDVLETVKIEIPTNKIGIRLNPSMHNLAGITIDEETIPTFDYIVKKLNSYNLAYLHLSEPFTDVSNVPFAVQEIAKHYRPLYNGTLMINSGFTQETGNKIIENNEADLVAYGKPFISNPDLVNRFLNNYPLQNWDTNTFYTTGAKGYLDYSFYK